MAASPAPVPVPPSLLRVLRDGPVPLRDGSTDPAAATSLRIAFVGPGGSVIADRLQDELATLGHDVSRWPREHSRLQAWEGADVAVAVSPRAAWRVQALEGCGARVLLLSADEETRIGASAARTWTTQALRSGLPVLCAGSELARRIAERHGATVLSFTPGIDPVYRSLPTHRRDDVVLLDAPAELPWRGAALALVAGRELHTRRPGLQLVVSRGKRPVAVPYDVLDLMEPDPEARAVAYSGSTVGVVCATDGLDPVVGEMLACGLPVVVLDEAAREAPAELGLNAVPPDPLAIADAVEALLEDVVARAARSFAGVEWTTGRTWAAAGVQVEQALRDTLRAAA